tara:strand:- start:1072 stop:1395 length:324 start_codon:yes stop_codon:yes gene_type:complete
MSIFQKKEIRVGDLVIGLNKYGWDNKGAASLHRYFSDPVMVLEIKSGQALLYFEQQGPQWYDINKLERVYVTEEFTDKDRRALAPIEFNNSDQSRNEDDNGDKRGDN